MTELGIWLFGFIGGVSFQIYVRRIDLPPPHRASPATIAVLTAALLGAVALVAPDAVS